MACSTCAVCPRSMRLWLPGGHVRYTYSTTARPMALVGSLIGHSVLITDCPGAIDAICQGRHRLTSDAFERIAAVCPGFCRR